jgi:pimeloyl-ACP methyl ester carboxylesterase
LYTATPLQAWIPRSGWHRAMQKANPKGLPAEFVDKTYDEYDRGTRRAVLLAESGHWPFQDDPQSVAEAVLPFLREQLQSAVAPS